MKNQLVEKIQQGDHDAFEGLFRNHYADLCRFACHYVKSSEIAEDLVQNVFLKIWQNHRNWRPRRTVKSYLYKAVHNQARNYARRKSVEKKWEEETAVSNVAHSPSSEAAWYEKELFTALEKPIEQLPKRCRMVFVLSRVNGLKYAEIAETLGISVRTVEVQMGRALEKLRRVLGPLLPPS